jgi:nicotinamide mononucleotide transporter
VLTVLIGYFFDKYTAAAATYLDAFTTVFSVIATVLVTRKILENWLYWIVIDLVFVYLYSQQGGYGFAFLNVIFTIVAIIGFQNWKKMKNN